MGYEEFNLGKHKKKRNVMVAECPIITVVLGTIFDVLLFYYYLGIIIETLLGAGALIVGIVFLSKGIKDKIGVRWWTIVLIIMGLLILVVSWVFPVWLWLIVMNTTVAIIVAIVSAIFIALTILTEVLRSRKRDKADMMSVKRPMEVSEEQIKQDKALFPGPMA